VLPEAAKNAGCFSLAELQKKDDIFVGTGRYSCVCQYNSKWDGRLLTNKFTLEDEVEISKISPTRIEGIAKKGPILNQASGNRSLGYPNESVAPPTN